jgi:NADH:ubiquinone reductase (non-electrogenic)
MEKKKLKTFDALLKSAQGNDNKLIDIETFKNALHEVDSQMKNLPATAQVISIFSPSFIPSLNQLTMLF